VTTGIGEEGQPGQRIAALRSTDKGKSWHSPVYIESIGEVEDSYAVLLRVYSGESHIFYNYNVNNIREIIADDPPYPRGTLPDGDIGLRTPPNGGPIAGKHIFNVLSDSTFYCVYRCTDGYSVCSYNRDGEHTWSIPKYK
jgi:hypothetical protein